MKVRQLNGPSKAKSNPDHRIAVGVDLSESVFHGVSSGSDWRVATAPSRGFRVHVVKRNAFSHLLILTIVQPW